MKQFLIICLLAMGGLSAQAQNSGASVLSEYVKEVRFAPPGLRGTFKFQILTSGVVQSVDNKDQVDVVAKLSPDVMSKLAAAIDSINNNVLTAPPTPPCTDSPELKIVVRQSQGTVQTIWERIDCLESVSSSIPANRTANIISTLEAAFASIKYLTN